MRLRLALLSVFAGFGCNVTEVGSPSGVFPCVTADECPPEQACVVGKCFAGAAPEVVVVNPEDEQAVPWTPGAGSVDVAVKVGGSGLELVDPASNDNEFGSGNIVLFVDDVQVSTLTLGSLAAGVNTMVPVPAEPGPHRIKAEARFSNGTTYDNVEASSTRLFWFDDGNPWVAFKTPTPNQRFSYEEIEIEVSVAALNFAIVPPSTTAMPGNIGHAHLLFNKNNFPECADAPACYMDYLDVLAPTEPGPFTNITQRSTLPSSAAGAPTTLTAHLTRTDHTSFMGPDGLPVWDTIPIVRVEAPAPDSAEND